MRKHFSIGHSMNMDVCTLLDGAYSKFTNTDDKKLNLALLLEFCVIDVIKSVASLTNIVQISFEMRDKIARRLEICNLLVVW